MMGVIRTEDLGKTYRGGTVALKGVSIEVEPGEILGFLGPNGAGKSTTIRLLLNFMRPTRGAAFLFGRPVTCAKTRKRLGYLPETVRLHSYYSGQGLLEFYAGLAGLKKEGRPRRAAQLLSYIGLADAQNKRVSKFSKGMLQRIGLAQALIHDPDLLILDEPTSNLDPVGRRDFCSIMKDCKQRGKTVFICSHVLSEVEAVCDRVGILQGGILTRIGTLEELSADRGSRVFVRKLPASAIAALCAAGARLTFQGKEATIACQSTSVREEVERVLEHHGVEAERIEIQRESLEDIFFSALDRKEHS